MLVIGLVCMGFLIHCDDFFGGITNWPESKKPNFTNCNPD